MMNFCHSWGSRLNFRNRILALLCLLFTAALPRPVTLRAASAKPAGVATRAASWTLNQVLAQLDRGASSFRTLSAHVERTKVTVVVNDRSTESGEFYVRRDGKMRLDLTAPDTRTILRNGDSLFIFTPRIKQVDEYNLSKHRDLVDQFLLLGFGTSSHMLDKEFLITLQGEQTIGDRKTILLELTPKSEEVRNQISKIQLWIDEATWLPVQQKFFETGTQDYFIIAYSNVVRNAPLNSDLFKPRWPKGTKRIKPQG
jgi:outer membrane lipoprotein-sorting protein